MIRSEMMWKRTSSSLSPCQKIKEGERVMISSKVWGSNRPSKVKPLGMPIGPTQPFPPSQVGPHLAPPTAFLILSILPSFPCVFFFFKSSLCGVNICFYSLYLFSLSLYLHSFPSFASTKSHICLYLTLIYVWYYIYYKVSGSLICYIIH